jgi:hypothetical protein
VAKVALRIENQMPGPGVALLRHSYLFVNERWQHMNREPIPDQGFEERFRESCIQPGWVVSQYREMNFGSALGTASGVLHEVDLVSHSEPVRGVFEFKNRPEMLPEKNDVIVFFAKILDYLCLNPSLLKQTLVPVFLTTVPFEWSGLAACLGLGIHPVAPGLRPLPLLIHNARCMCAERDKGTVVAEADSSALDDFCVELNRLSAILTPADLNQRCDLLNDETVTIRATRVKQPGELGDQLRTINAECTRLIDVFKAAAVRRTS